MNTLNTHNEEMEKLFHGYWRGFSEPSEIEHSITYCHKQLYIKIAEEEIKRFEEHLKINKAELEKVSCLSLDWHEGIVTGRMEEIEESINYWNNILQELTN